MAVGRPWVDTPLMPLATLCRVGRCLFQQFVNERLVRLSAFGGHFSQLTQEPWRETDSDQLFRHAAGGPSYPSRTSKFFVRRLWDVREINLRVWYRLGVPAGSPAAR